MKKQRKLSLKKINIAPINYLQIIRGGSDETIAQNEGCLSEETGINTSCEPSAVKTNCSPLDSDSCPPTVTTRGNGSI
ncbi:hypothetical protein [uncultured Kordia sp.]|uniref:hypothetical protein n=1 Tax=uncultured Kordia sp. TaxID=507699 RepID=UPI0026130DF5|nr:hypothetical protein [uncultured Kordia sp.]